MDLRGGTLNYEGIKVLNNMEAAYSGFGKRGRLLCTPTCLKKVARLLEKRRETISPFKQIHTPFGEGIELDYKKITRLVLNAFSLEDAAKQHSANISASIDAARMSKKHAPHIIWTEDD
jgi:hypothetical protein